MRHTNQYDNSTQLRVWIIDNNPMVVQKATPMHQFNVSSNAKKQQRLKCEHTSMPMSRETKTRTDQELTASGIKLWANFRYTLFKNDTWTAFECSSYIERMFHSQSNFCETNTAPIRIHTKTLCWVKSFVFFLFLFHKCLVKKRLAFYFDWLCLIPTFVLAVNVGKTIQYWMNLVIFRLVHR